MNFHDFNLLFGVVMLSTLIFLMSACVTSHKTPGKVILPGAYQFCLDHPKHEECTP